MNCVGRHVMGMSTNQEVSLIRERNEWVSKKIKKHAVYLEVILPALSSGYLFRSTLKTGVKIFRVTNTNTRSWPVNLREK